jgi:sorbitol/mannitol transport system substrate-binding protein
MHQGWRSNARQIAAGWALAACGLVHAGEVTEITVAAVNNRQMVTMQKLGAHFEKSNTDIRIKWAVMNEAELRQRVSQEVAARGAQFDVVTIGMYETPLWAARGWLREITTSDSYQVKDLIPTVRDGLSHGKRLYAAPFYGEGSMTVYRSDLLAKTGVSLVNRPSWDQIAVAAAKIHNPAAGVYGICLRGRAGWGDNMALLSTMARPTPWTTASMTTCSSSPRASAASGWMPRVPAVR